MGVPPLYIIMFFECFSVVYVVFWGGGRTLLVVRGCGICAIASGRFCTGNGTVRHILVISDIVQVRVVDKDEGSGMEHCENVHICMDIYISR